MDKAVTLRLDETAINLLKRCCYVMRKTQATVVAEALAEYSMAHGLGTTYQLRVTTSHAVLIKLNGDSPTVVDAQTLNGVPAAQLAEDYSKRFKCPVALIVEGETP